MRRRAAGFTYLGLIIVVALIGLVGAALLKVDALAERAAREEELLEIGAQFSQALASYAAATPPGQPQQPATLAELLRDPRFPNTRRHLRKIFVDPMTGKAEWGIMYLGEKTGVVAVYSLSNAVPLKVANFDTRFPNFANKGSISEWRFTASGGGVISSGGMPSMPSTPMTPPPVPVIMPTTPVEPPAEPPPEARLPPPADPADPADPDAAPAEPPPERGDASTDGAASDGTQAPDAGGQDAGGQGGAVFQNPDKPADPAGNVGGNTGASTGGKGAQRPQR